MLFQTFSSFRKKESYPSHEFAGDRKNLLASVFQLHRNKPQGKPIEWPIFRVLPFIFLW